MSMSKYTTKMHPLNIGTAKVLNNLTSYEDLVLAHKRNPRNTVWKSILAICNKPMERILPDVFPLLFNYLPESDILNCRLVCNGWKNAVEIHLETDRPPIMDSVPYNGEQIRKRPRTLEVDFNACADRLKLPLMETMTRFMSEFSAGDKAFSTGFCRSVKLHISELNNVQLNFFENFGSRLFSLELYIFQKKACEIICPVRIVKFVLLILKLLPNLKTLVLLTAQSIARESVFSVDMRAAQKRKLKRLLARRPPSPLSQLKNLKLLGNIPLINEALHATYAHQLEKFAQDPFSNYVPLRTPDLYELSWCLDANYANSNLAALESLGCHSLQRLSLYISNSGEENRAYVSTGQLFTSIESFKTSLNRLFITWKKFIGSFPAQLDLPLVEELLLEIHSCISYKDINLSFLKSLKSLRKLKFVFWRSCYVEILKIRKRLWRPTEDDAIDLHYFLDGKSPGGLYGSNVWSLLPSLEEIEIQVASEFMPHSLPPPIVYTRVQKNKMQIKCIKSV